MNILLAISVSLLSFISLYDALTAWMFFVFCLTIKNYETEKYKLMFDEYELFLKMTFDGGFSSFFALKSFLNASFILFKGVVVIIFAYNAIFTEYNIGSYLSIVIGLGTYLSILCVNSVIKIINPEITAKDKELDHKLNLKLVAFLFSFTNISNRCL